MGRYTGPVEKLSRREGVQRPCSSGRIRTPLDAAPPGGDPLALRIERAGRDNLTGRVELLPDGHESNAPVDPQLIVELYSK
jgi:hypothetical protein